MSFLIVSSKLNVREQTVAQAMEVINARISSRVGKMAVFVIKALSPVRTGELRDSVKIIESSQRQSGGEYRGFIKIGPTASHAKFILKGTKFIRKNNFVKRAKPIIISETNRLIAEEYNKGKFNVARYFRLGK